MIMKTTTIGEVSVMVGASSVLLDIAPLRDSIRSKRGTKRRGERSVGTAVMIDAMIVTDIAVLAWWAVVVVVGGIGTKTRSTA